MNHHLGQPRFKCDLCSLRFKWRQQKWEHMATRHSVSGTAYQCDKCNVSFHTSMVYLKHKALHADRRTSSGFFAKHIKCSCGHIITHHRELWTHVQNHQRAKETDFARALAKKYFGDRILECTFKFCRKMFLTTWALRLHEKKTHIQAKSHVCDYPKCGKAFVLLQDLRDHNDTHFGLKKHICRHCGKAFAAKPNLVVHRRLRCVAAQKDTQQNDLRCMTVSQKSSSPTLLRLS